MYMTFCLFGEHEELRILENILFLKLDHTNRKDIELFSTLVLLA
jgi:hypothetical protein